MMVSCGLSYSEYITATKITYDTHYANCKQQLLNNSIKLYPKSYLLSAIEIDALVIRSNTVISLANMIFFFICIVAVMDMTHIII